MNVTNAIVVYFAFGMPFGVLSIALLRGRVDHVNLFRVIYELVFWPLIVFKSALAHLRSQAQLRNTEKTYQLWNRNHVDIERRTDRRKALSGISVFEGMNAVYDEMLSAIDLRSFFHECVDHPNPKLAAKCLQRRYIARLELHIHSARDEISQSPGRPISQDNSSDQMFLPNGETTQHGT